MSGANQHVLRLSTLLQLEQRARRCSAQELAFLMVNDTTGVVAYQQAVLWQRALPGTGKVVALSGASSPDAAAPYVVWLHKSLAAMDLDDDGVPRPIQATDLPQSLAAEWAEWLPAHALYCPLDAGQGQRLGGLLLARSAPWHEGDIRLLSVLAGAYAQAWLLASRPPAALPWMERLRQRRRLVIGVAAMLSVLALLPVRQSVLAPAEVVPITPMQIRAPFDGVVDSIAITPNAQVNEGQVLVSLDTTQLRTKQRVAAKSREIAEAEYGQAAQQALSDPSVKGRLALLQSKIDQQSAELAFAEEQLRRAELSAPASGIAVFDDANDWIGRPVTVGERIMTVADPTRVELEIQVPVGDVATFETGAETLFFPNVAPDRPISASLVFASHVSQLTAESVLAHRFRAGFDGQGGDLRLGMKGTAKIYGDRRPLLLWLLRRPLAIVRQWLTL